MSSKVLSIDADGNFKEIIIGDAGQEVFQGLFANRPAAGTINRLYYATDTQQLFLDDGSAWLTIPIGQPQWAVDLQIPTGFINISSSIIRPFNYGTLTFTIDPNSSYIFYNHGARYVKSSQITKTISSTAGLWYFYFDSSGTIQATQTSSTYEANTKIAMVYLNTSQGWGEVIDDRHLINNEAAYLSLKYIHGGQHRSGLAVSGYTLNDSTSDAAVKIAIGNGRIANYDVFWDIIHAASPSNPFEQILSFPAQLPIWYLSGASSFYRDSASVFYMKNTTNGKVNYNSLSGGSWGQTEVSDQDYVDYWIIATPFAYSPIISLQGQWKDTTLQNAIDNSLWENLSFPSLPILDFRPLFCIVLQTAPGYTNTRKCKIVHVKDLRKNPTWNYSLL